MCVGQINTSGKPMFVTESTVRKIFGVTAQIFAEEVCQSYILNEYKLYEK